MTASVQVLGAPRFAWLTDNPGRRAGFLYLILLVLGPFSLLYVPGKLIVPGDAATTARNILASESLFRLSIVAGLAASIAFVFLARSLYRLLSSVNRAQASLMATLVYMSVAIGFALTVTDLAVLTVLRSTDLLAPFTQAQREALASFFVRLGTQGVLLSEVFWGLWLLPFGWLVMRSGFLPRILGVLLLVNGVAYVVASFIGLLFPDYMGVIRRMLLVPELGELWIILWLVIIGAKPRPASAAI